MASFSFCLSVICCCTSRAAESTVTPNAFHTYHRLNDERNQNQAFNLTSTLPLPLDLRTEIAEFLQRKDIHSFARSCKLNLYSCRQYIRRLLLIKFQFLLNHNHSKINIKHLLNIPLVDSITMNPLLMPFYFGIVNRSRASSKYIGVDGKTGNGFISFWMKRVHIKLQPWIILTFLFNSSSIECIILSDASRSALINDINSFKLLSFSIDIAAIEFLQTVLLHGKIDGIVGDEESTWCLYAEWDSCMFWVRVREKLKNPCPTPQQRRSWLLLCLICSLVFWLFITVAIMYAMNKANS